MDRFERGFDLSEYSLTEVHLHSNMDRFESYKKTHKLNKKIIIYIPIWIDLKANLSRLLLPLSVYLHSNMDRFESLFSSANFSLATNLHSNMDRFERLYRLHHVHILQYLHSNMDRFESFSPRFRSDLTAAFTFQYG